MNIDENEVVRFSEHIAERNVSGEAIEIARAAVASGFSLQLLTRAIQARTKVGDDYEDSIEATMDWCEKVAEQDSVLACMLMADLWSISSQTTMHWICDAIGLWLEGCPSVELRNHLVKLAENSTNPRVRRYYEEAAAKMRTR